MTQSNTLSGGTAPQSVCAHCKEAVYLVDTDCLPHTEEQSGAWATLATGVSCTSLDDEPHSVYAEAEPFGPTDTAQPGGDAQLSTAYSRRFTRKITGSDEHAVVDVECYVVDTNPMGEPNATIVTEANEIRPVLTQVTTFTICTDPSDPGSTEIQSDDRTVDHEVPRIPCTPDLVEAVWDTAARDLCASFTPATLTWNGERLG